MLNVMIYSYQLISCLWLNQCRIPPVLSALMDLPKQSHLSSRTDIPPHSTWQACLSAFNLMTRSIYRMWQSLQTVQGVGGGGGMVWTSPALLQCHISWQLPFSVPCFSLVASRLPSPHQLCFSRRLFLLRFPERRLKTAAGAAAVSSDISNMGLRASRPPPDPEWSLVKTENWNEKHPQLCALRNEAEMKNMFCPKLNGCWFDCWHEEKTSVTRELKCERQTMCSFGEI